MKKSVSLVLIAFLLLSSTPMHAGHELKKAWAYTKIGLGCGTGIWGVWSTIEGHATLMRMNDPNFDFKRYMYLMADAIQPKSKVLHSIDIDVLTWTVKEKFESKRRSIITLLPLGILLFQSGTRDLKRILKQEAKEAAQAKSDDV